MRFWSDYGTDDWEASRRLKWHAAERKNARDQWTGLWMLYPHFHNFGTFLFTLSLSVWAVVVCFCCMTMGLELLLFCSWRNQSPLSFRLSSSWETDDRKRLSTILRLIPFTFQHNKESAWNCDKSSIRRRITFTIENKAIRTWVAFLKSLNFICVL